MSNEIQLSIVVRVANPPFQDMVNPGQVLVDQTNVGQGGYVSSIPTSDTAVPGLTGLTANGYAVLQNLDETNYVVYGPDNGSGAIVPFGKLKPGEIAVLRIAPTVVLRAQADTAAVKLLAKVYED